MNRGMRTLLSPGAVGPQDENEIVADRVQTKANEIGQEAKNTVDDNEATRAAGSAAREVREIGDETARQKIKDTNMGDKAKEAGERW